MQKLLAAISLAAAVSVAHAQAWSPGKPVRFIVPQVAGGGADSIGRVIAAALSERVGQPLVVDNRPGANGGVGAEALIRSPADGHSVLLVFTSLMALNPAVYDKVPYDPISDFRPLGAVCEVPLVMLGSLSLEASNAAQLVDLAKAKPNTVFAASSGNGAFSHLMVEMLNSRAGIRMTHVPFKGEAPAVQHLMSNQNQAIYVGTPALAIPNVNAGRIKALAVTTLTRSKLVPELPTVDESGLKGFETVAWFGLLAPAGTPPAVITRTRDEVARILQTDELRARIESLGGEPVGNTPQEFAAIIGRDIAKWRRLVDQAGIKAD